VSLDEVESTRPVGLQWLLHSEDRINAVPDGAVIRCAKSRMRVFFPPRYLKVSACREPGVEVERKKPLVGWRLAAWPRWKGPYMILPAVMLFGKGQDKAVVEFPDTRTTLGIRILSGGKQYLFGWKKVLSGWEFTGLRITKKGK